MVNKKKLYTAMSEHDMTPTDVASYLHISLVTFYRRIKNDTFRGYEAQMLSELFGKDVVAEIFFSEPVAEKGD